MCFRVLACHLKSEYRNCLSNSIGILLRNFHRTNLYPTVASPDLKWTKIKHMHNMQRRLMSSTFTCASKFTSHQLKHRGVVRVAGKDAAEFLQGLITNDMDCLSKKCSSIYAMMLNVQVQSYTYNLIFLRLIFQLVALQ